MIAYRSNDIKDDKLSHLQLRNIINRDLIAAKAAESIQLTGISRNRKGNMLLYTHCGFQNLDFDLLQATITEAVQRTDSLTLQQTGNMVQDCNPPYQH